MPADYSPVLHLDALTRESFTRGEGYASEDADLAGPLQLTALGAVLTEVPPGKSSCPFHVHHAEDEMFVILEGEGAYRFGADSYPVRAGDVLGAPRGGPDSAHKLTNTGESPLRYLAISSKASIDVCEYPDSGKFMVSSRGAGKLLYIGREGDTLDYWDGEEDS
jgi:uncharacterized cupin superfamily protein